MIIVMTFMYKLFKVLSILKIISGSPSGIGKIFWSNHSIFVEIDVTNSGTFGNFQIKLNLLEWYFYVPVHPEDIPKMEITTPFGNVLK